jgi:dTDP-4-amino-4,6-dideoxygalactose transaminase
LANIDGIRLPCTPSWGGHVYQSFVILVDPEIDRDQLIHDLRACDIETTLGTYAVHAQPFYEREYGYKPGQLPNSFYAFTRSVTLPLFHQMTENDLETIAVQLEKAIASQWVRAREAS